MTREVMHQAHHTLQERLAELHLYEEINEHYAKCNAGAENLRDWVAERMDIEPVQPAKPYAYAVYFPDMQNEELVHNLDDACEAMTNNRYEVTPLFHAQPEQPAQSKEPNELS